VKADYFEQWTLFFAYYQFIIGDSEDNLQRRTFTLQSTEKKFVSISPENLRLWHFLEQNPLGCKTIVDNKCLQQVKNFKYLGCEIFYENKKFSTETKKKIA
jgi:hypothetical protein